MTSETMEYKTKPFAHQITALSRWRGKRRFGLFCEMGTGKTWIAINHAAEEFFAGNLNRVLVLGPRSLLGVWEREIETHCSVKYKTLILDKPKKWEQLKKPFDPAVLTFVVSNYDVLITAKSSQFPLSDFQLVLMDESTMLKNHSAQRTKACKKLVDQIPEAAIMTGNETPNGPLDLFSQFNILDPNILGFTNFYAFRGRYAVMGGYRVGGRLVQIMSYREDLIKKELQPRMAPHIFRVSKAECLDLPPKLFQQRDIYLTTEQSRVYEDLKRQAVAEFKGKQLLAPIVIARLTRLSQIAGGFFPNEDGGRPFKNNPKVIELGNILDGGSGKTLVWCRFRSELKAVTDYLDSKEIGYVPFQGDMNSGERKEAVEKFQTDPSCRVFVGITSCGRFGLTLTEGKTVVYFSNSYSFEDRSQSEDRCHRAGLKHPVTYIDLVAVGTIDRIILDALKSKKDLSEFIRGLSAEEIF